MKRCIGYLHLGMIAIGVMWFAACDSGGSNGSEEPMFDRAAMLNHLGNNLIIPAYQNAQAAVLALQTAADAFVADPTPASLVALQAALKQARLAWQDVELFQFGPAESLVLRGSLNTYPTDTDQIEANIASGTYVIGTVANLDAGGFPALDYLLHGVGNSTEEILSIYTTDTGGRIAYLKDNVLFIQSNIDEVTNQWMPNGGNYIETFLSQEKAGVDVGSSLGALVNALVLHYERFIRDGKIGIPTGVRSSGVPRPRATEAFYGGYSLELVRAAVAAVDRLFRGTGFDGTGGIGFDENLQFLGATDLATDIKTALTNIDAALAGLSDPLSELVESDTDAAVSVFTQMQTLVVLLKADMTSRLGITITFQDNDGD